MGTMFFINIGNAEGTRERDNRRANSKRGDRNNAAKEGSLLFGGCHRDK